MTNNTWITIHSPSTWIVSKNQVEHSRTEPFATIMLNLSKYFYIKKRDLIFKSQTKSAKPSRKCARTNVYLLKKLETIRTQKGFSQVFYSALKIYMLYSIYLVNTWQYF